MKNRFFSCTVRDGFLSALLLAICALPIAAQPTRRIIAGTPPTVCNPNTGDVYVDTSVTPPDLLHCVASNKYERVSTGKVNSQTGTSYTFVKADRAKLVTSNNASAVAWTLPQATASGDFLSGWMVYTFNLGAGTVTITPTTSTINGGATLTLAQNEGAVIFSNGSNYSALKTGVGGGGGVTSVTATSPIVSSGGATPNISCPTCGTGGSILYDSFANRPSVGTSGRLFLCSDCVLDFYDDGTQWIPRYGSRTFSQVPALSNWTQVNGTSGGQSATFADQQGTIYIKAPSGISGGAHQVRVLSKAQPSTPYTVIAAVQGRHHNANYYSFGIGFRNSTNGKMMTIVKSWNGSNQLEVWKWTDASTFAGTIYSLSYDRANFFKGDLYWFKIENDGTNLTLSISNHGEDWVIIRTETIATFMSSVDHICIVAHTSDSTADASNYAVIKVLSWNIQ